MEHEQQSGRQQPGKNWHGQKSATGAPAPCADGNMAVDMNNRSTTTSIIIN